MKEEHITTKPLLWLDYFDCFWFTSATLSHREVEPIKSVHLKHLMILKGVLRMFVLPDNLRGYLADPHLLEWVGDKDLELNYSYVIFHCTSFWGCSLGLSQ